MNPVFRNVKFTRWRFYQPEKMFLLIRVKHETASKFLEKEISEAKKNGKILEVCLLVLDVFIKLNWGEPCKTV